MATETSLLALLASREFSASIFPLKSPYSEITIHRVDVSAHFSFPGARELLHIAVPADRLLDDEVYDMIDERISAFGLTDRPKILEFTTIAPAVRDLLAQVRSVALLERADIETLLVRRQPVKSFLRKLFATSFSLRILNPYIFRGPVSGRQFFGREDEIATLRSQAQRSYIISGARRSGKTSLLLETKRRLDAFPQSDEIVVYLTFENCKTFADIPRALLSALPDETSNYRRLAYSDRWRFPQNLSRLVTPLTHYLQVCRRNTRVVRFFFDEYDRVIKSGLTGIIREILVEQKKQEGKRNQRPFQVQVAFAGSTLLYEELLSKNSPIYNFATKLPLHNFDLKTLTALVTLPLRDIGIDVQNPHLVAQTMLDITGGHPSTCQHLCSILVEHLSSLKSPVVGIEEMKRAGREPEFLGEFVDTIDHNISPLGRFILAVVARSQRPLFDIDYFCRSGSAHGVHFERTVVGVELAGLADSGYLTTVNSGHSMAYKLAIPTVKRVYFDFDSRELIPDMLAYGQCTRDPFHD